MPRGHNTSAYPNLKVTNRDFCSKLETIYATLWDLDLGCSSCNSWQLANLNQKRNHQWRCWYQLLKLHYNWGCSVSMPIFVPAYSARLLCSWLGVKVSNHSGISNKGDCREESRFPAAAAHQTPAVIGESVGRLTENLDPG